MEDRVDDDAQLGAVLSRILVLPRFETQVAFHIDRGALGHVFHAVVRLVSVNGQIDVNDIFTLFAGLRLVAAVDGHPQVADGGAVLWEGLALRFACQFAHEKDFVEVRHDRCAPALKCFPCLYHNIINENFL